MIIASSAKYIFIHIHKCAGSSIEVALDPFLKWNDLLLGTTDNGEKIAEIYDLRFGLSKHAGAIQIRDAIGVDAWRQYYSFATVRHPFARMVSVFNYISAVTEQFLESNFISPPASGIREWLESTEFPANSVLNWPAVRAYLIARNTGQGFSRFIRDINSLQDDVSFATQFSRLSDEQGNLLVREIYAVESLQKNWPNICRRIGVPAVPLPRENVTDARYKALAQDLLACQADRDYLYDLYRIDFDAFKYSEQDI